MLNQQNLNHDGIYSCTGIYFFKSALTISAPLLSLPGNLDPNTHYNYNNIEEAGNHIDYLPYKIICIKFYLLKLNFCNYILCLIKRCVAIFCIIILNILCILHRFRTFCKHFATAITSNHSLSVFLCTPSIHPLKYGTHSYCRLKSACGLL